MEDLFSKIWVLLTVYGLKVIAAIAVFIVGRWIAKILTTFTEKVMNKRQIDPTIVSFVGNLIYIALLVFVVLVADSRTARHTDNVVYRGYRCRRPCHRSCAARITGELCRWFFDDHFSTLQSW